MSGYISEKKKVSCGYFDLEKGRDKQLLSLKSWENSKRTRLVFSVSDFSLIYYLYVCLYPLVTHLDNS